MKYRVKLAGTLHELYWSRLVFFFFFFFLIIAGAYYKLCQNINSAKIKGCLYYHIKHIFQKGIT